TELSHVLRSYHSLSHCYVDSRGLRSFPTRRSSDLVGHGDRFEDGPSLVHCFLPFKTGNRVCHHAGASLDVQGVVLDHCGADGDGDRKSTRLNSSHVKISYAVFCLKKKNKHVQRYDT